MFVYKTESCSAPYSLCVKTVLALITRDGFTGLNTPLSVNLGNLKRRGKGPSLCS